MYLASQLAFVRCVSRLSVFTLCEGFGPLTTAIESLSNERVHRRYSSTNISLDPNKL